MRESLRSLRDRTVLYINRIIIIILYIMYKTIFRCCCFTFFVFIFKTSSRDPANIRTVSSLFWGRRKTRRIRSFAPRDGCAVRPLA